LHLVYQGDAEVNVVLYGKRRDQLFYKIDSKIVGKLKRITVIDDTRINYSLLFY